MTGINKKPEETSSEATESAEVGTENPRLVFSAPYNLPNFIADAYYTSVSNDKFNPHIEIMFGRLVYTERYANGDLDKTKKVVVGQSIVRLPINVAAGLVHHLIKNFADFFPPEVCEQFGMKFSQEDDDKSEGSDVASEEE